MRNAPFYPLHQSSTKTNAEEISSALLRAQALPENFDSAQLPDISDVPRVLRIKPPWHESNSRGHAIQTLYTLLESISSLDEIRSLFAKGWLSTEDARNALGLLLGKGQTDLNQLQTEDRIMIGATPDQFSFFIQTGILVMTPPGLTPIGVREHMAEILAKKEQD